MERVGSNLHSEVVASLEYECCLYAPISFGNVAPTRCNMTGEMLCVSRYGNMTGLYGLQRYTIKPAADQ